MISLAQLRAICSLSYAHKSILCTFAKYHLITYHSLSVFIKIIKLNKALHELLILSSQEGCVILLCLLHSSERTEAAG
jgi:hypothetical protein